ncbi:DUF2199 domain-containing protein [Thalassovita sp.]|jgi:hypothetical protein|uniref:DUF2199 domain-containing protein n=1 Tax=Thalassovita sp. TaxID=1979401 RepID=UPI003B5C53B4
MSLLALDARWRRFNDPDRECPCCGRRFSGVYDIAYDHPARWPHPERGDQPFVKAGEDQLAADLCRVGGVRLLRAHAALPIHGAEDMLHLTPWVAVPDEVFFAYLDTTDSADAPLPAPAQGLLDNDLPDLAETGTAVTVHFDTREALPRIEASAGPLADALQNGISFDQLLDLYAACGDDIRPHLLRD